ncbi:protein Abitram [Chelonus insularis]|uniref:protein Abitram n=1 Tax=Chelonus insularis TaxID=460826 RepID=UPI00158E8304|nr:protein Abitram [Chelonus insularis]
MKQPCEIKNLDDEDDGFKFPEDYNVDEMLDEVPLDQKLPSVTDRYFTPFYKIDAQKPHNDICIRIHSNRICMLTLAPSHALLQKGKEIEKISFKVTDKLDRTNNKLSGKAKHGAQPLQENSNICIITSSDGENWPIKCCMTGKLIEVNEALQENPLLIKQSPHRGGYIAIALPNIKAHEKMKDILLNEDQYQAAIEERTIAERDNNLHGTITVKRTRDEDNGDLNRDEKIIKTE